jgi:flagellar biosynthesis protein FliR
MEFSLGSIMDVFHRFIWPTARISGFIVMAPLFSNFAVTRLTKLTFVVVLSLIAGMIIAKPNPIDPLSLLGLITIIREFILGLLIGFALSLIFQAFVVGGQIVAMQSGLGFAAMVDPSSGGSVPLISQLYLFFISLVFFALDGHLQVIQLLINSFLTLPISPTLIAGGPVEQVLDFSKIMFTGAVMVALPAIISLLTVNLSFGVMTRAAPQLNIFTIGFPITLVLGLIFIYLTLYQVPTYFGQTLGEATTLISKISGGQ